MGLLLRLEVAAMWWTQLSPGPMSRVLAAAPSCPRGLLEEECHTLEREIPILQVSHSPALSPKPHC